MLQREVSVVVINRYLPVIDSYLVEELESAGTGRPPLLAVFLTTKECAYPKLAAKGNREFIY
jgi:hypothetical protein